MLQSKLVLTISILSLAFSNSYFSEDQLNVTVSLAQYFKIAFCVLKMEKGIMTGVISNKKHPSKQKLFTAAMNSEGVTGLVTGTNSSLSGGRTMVVMKMNNETLILLHQNTQNFSISSIVWILFSDYSLQLDLFSKIRIPFDCEFLYVYQNIRFFSLTEIYNIGKNSKTETYYLGKWTKEKNLALEDTYFYNRRKSFKGHKFRALIKNDPPYVMIEKNKTGDFVYRGYLLELWRELEFRLNFTTEFSSKYFEDDPNTVLGNKEVDFAVARISNDPHVFGMIDFSQPISEAKTYTFSHRPGTELDWDSYLKPFSANTWLVNLTWMISSALALAFLYKTAWTFGTSEREADYFIFTLSESILTVLRAVCMQGSDNTPRSASCRLFFLSIYLSALVVTSAFSAALFSLLTVPKPRFLFKNVEDILGNKKFKIGFPSDPNFLNTVKDFSTFSSPSKLNNSTILRNLLDSAETWNITPQEGLERLCQDKFYVFIFDLPNVLHLMQTMTKTCQDKILSSGPPLFTSYISFGFTKNNPYKKLFDYHITQLKNDGILHRILLNYWPPKIPTVQATWVRVTLADISPILYMFILGLILGMIILYGEKIIYHFKKKTEKTKKKEFLNKKLIISGYPLYRY